jgi:hypothetical protein
MQTVALLQRVIVMVLCGFGQRLTQYHLSAFTTAQAQSYLCDTTPLARNWYAVVKME